MLADLRSVTARAGASPAFTELLEGILRKNPAERMDWTAISRHRFWKVSLTEYPLPPQPSWEKYILSRRPANPVVNPEQKVSSRLEVFPAVTPVEMPAEDGKIKNHKSFPSAYAYAIHRPLSSFAMKFVPFAKLVYILFR